MCLTSQSFIWDFLVPGTRLWSPLMEAEWRFHISQLEVLVLWEGLSKSLVYWDDTLQLRHLRTGLEKPAPYSHFRLCHLETWNSPRTAWGSLRS